MQRHDQPTVRDAVPWLALGCAAVVVGLAAWWLSGPTSLRAGTDAYGVTTAATASAGTHWYGTEPLCVTSAGVVVQDIWPANLHGSGEVGFGTREVYGEFGGLTGHMLAEPPGWQEATGSDVVEQCAPGDVMRQVVVRMERAGSDPLMVDGLQVRYADAHGRTSVLSMPARFTLCGESHANDLLPEDVRETCTEFGDDPD